MPLGFVALSLYELFVCFDNLLMFQAKEPKQTINLSSLTVTLAPEKISHPHGLQLSFMTENLTRQIYLYHELSKVSFPYCI